MALPSYLSNLANREPDALTKLEKVQADGTPLLVSANRFEGNITQANQTSQTNIGSLVVFMVEPEEQRNMITRIFADVHKITSNPDITTPSLSETNSCKRT